MRFVAAAILFAVIVAISAPAVSDFLREVNITRFSSDLTVLDARASAIYQQGGARDVSVPADNTGTKEKIKFTVPDGIELVAFGTMPPHKGSASRRPDPHENNIIYYTTSAGVTRTISSKASYAAAPYLDAPVILTPGSYELTMELVKNRNGMYITFY